MSKRVKNPAAKELSAKQFHPKTKPDLRKSKMEEIAEREWQELIDEIQKKSERSMKKSKPKQRTKKNNETPIS